MVQGVSRVGAFSVSKGFSLFELLIVMVILGLITAVSIPWFNRMRRRSELRSAAMEIGTTLVAARMNAVKRNASVSVMITPAASAEGSHEIDTIEPTPPTTPAPTPAANPGPHLLLAGRALRFVETPSGGAITFDGAGRRTTPGAPTPGRIVIEGPIGGGNVNQMTIDTNTAGKVSITPPVNWQ